MTENKRGENKVSFFKILFRVFTLILALATAYVVIGMAVKKARGEVFYFGDKAVVFVMSASMEPKISAGSFIVVERIDSDDVQVHDIVMFVSNDPTIKGQFNTHEVIGISDDRQIFYTQGLNNPSPDNYPPNAEDIRAKWVKNADFLNRCFGWFLTKAGLLITLIAIASLSVAAYLPEWIAEKRRHSEKEIAKKDALIQEKIKEEVERLQRENGTPQSLK